VVLLPIMFVTTVNAYRQAKKLLTLSFNND
jgi:hypothetical protein